MHVLRWFKSSDCNWKEPTSPSLIHYGKSHSNIQRLFNKYCNPTPYPVLIFPTFFFLAVFTPVLLCDHICNGVIFMFLCSLNQQKFHILLTSLHVVKHQHISAFIAHMLWLLNSSPAATSPSSHLLPTGVWLTGREVLHVVGSAEAQLPTRLDPGVALTCHMTLDKAVNSNVLEI